MAELRLHYNHASSRSILASEVVHKLPAFTIPMQVSTLTRRACLSSWPPSPNPIQWMLRCVRQGTRASGPIHAGVSRARLVTELRKPPQKLLQLAIHSLQKKVL